MTDAAKAFIEMMRLGEEMRRRPSGTQRARALPTERLRALWDSYDGAETADPAVSGEAVHLVLNERGDGDYCRV